jgi:hypothetical protein
VEERDSSYKGADSYYYNKKRDPLYKGADSCHYNKGRNSPYREAEVATISRRERFIL